MTTAVKFGANVTDTASAGGWWQDYHILEGSDDPNTTGYAAWWNVDVPGEAGPATAYIQVGGYDFSTISAGDNLTSLTLLVLHRSTYPARFTSIVLQPYLGSTPIGSSATSIIPTLGTTDSGDRYETFTFPAVTTAQLKDATFHMRASGVRSSTTATFWWGLAYMRLTAVSAAPVGKPKAWTGAAWVEKPVKYWTGSTWVTKPMKAWTGSTWKPVS